MKEQPLERWLADEQADPELRRLLQAGRNDRPRRQAMRVAPLAISALLTVNTAAAVAPVAGGALRNAFTATLIKWCAAGAIVSATAISVTQSLKPVAPTENVAMQRALPSARPRTSVRAVPPRAVPPISAAAQSSSPAVTAQQVTAAAHSNPASADVRDKISSEAPPSAASVTARAPQPDVAREVALLDQARGALLRGHAQRALDTLSELDRLPARWLQPEATVLRVRALLALNDVQSARQVAARFITAAPGSPQAPVLRGLFADHLETQLKNSATPSRIARSKRERVSSGE